MTGFWQIFSCGFSMFNTNPTTYPDGQAFFWELNGQYSETADDTFYDCRSGSVDEDGLFTSAYTIEWTNPNAAQIIRFCPLFLSHIAAQRWSSSDQVDPE